MDSTLCVIFLSSSFGLWATTSGNDEGLLLLARAGGRYDPLQLWYGKPQELWATNQCELDETESFRNHCIKGNFRSPRIGKLSTYAKLELEFVVFNKHGDKLLSLKGCKMNDNGTRGMECDDPGLGSVVVGEELDAMGGFVVKTKDSGLALALMYNHGYYFDNGANSEVILLPYHGKTVQAPRTGYIGCIGGLPKSSGTKGKKVSVDSCVLTCKSEKFAVLKNDGTSSVCECFDGKVPMPKNESFCNSSCDGNVNQICGGVNVGGVYNVKDNLAFKSIGESVKVEKQQEERINDSRTTRKVIFNQRHHLVHVQIDEDPECNLTNIYFNTSSPSYNISLFKDIRCNSGHLKTMVVHAKETPWDLGYLMPQCVLIEPLPHNCTYHRSTFTFYGLAPVPDLIPINNSYIGIWGTWVEALPTTEKTTSKESPGSSSGKNALESQSSPQSKHSGNSSNATDAGKGSTAANSVNPANAASIANTARNSTDNAANASDTILGSKTWNSQVGGNRNSQGGANGNSQVSGNGNSKGSASGYSQVGGNGNFQGNASGNSQLGRNGNSQRNGSGNSQAGGNGNSQGHGIENSQGGGVGGGGVGGRSNKGQGVGISLSPSDSKFNTASDKATGSDQATSPSDAFKRTTQTSKGSTKTTNPSSSTLRTTTPFSTEFDVSNVTTPVPAVREACTCLCVEKPRKNQTKVMVAKEKAIKIHKKLKIDTMNLSSSVRRKVSAPDNRITAAVGGYLGICLLTIALGSLILADITSITRHIRLVRNKNPSPPTKGGEDWHVP